MINVNSRQRMARYVLHILPFALLCLAVFGCEAPPQLKPLPPNAVILAFGDSLTRGTGAGDEQAYPEILAQLLSRKVINAGIPGETSAKGLERLPKVLAKYQPDLVILCHGGNDFLRRLNRAQTIDNIRAMVSLIRAQGADVVLVGVPQLGLFLKPPEFYREIAREYKIPYDAEIISALLSDQTLKSDHIHPNAAGYRQMAQALHTLIQDNQGR